MDPTTTAIGTWSGGRFMHFGEPLGDERLTALLRPGEGIDTVITADVYGAGEADRLLGSALAGRGPRQLLPDRRDRARLLRRRARRRQGLPPLHRPRGCAGPSEYADYIRMATERSLERCGVEQFDLLLLHNPDHIGYSSPAVWEGMRAVREAGSTRMLGVAPGPANGFTLDLIDCLERFSEDIDWAMIILNPLEPWPGELVLDAAAAHGVSLITRVVDYGGLFHDDVLAGHAFAEHDHRRFRPEGWVERGPREARADAPLRRAPRADDAAARLRLEPRASPRALRRADPHPGGAARRRGRSRTSAPSSLRSIACSRRAPAERRGGRGDPRDRREHRLHGAEGREPRTRGPAASRTAGRWTASWRAVAERWGIDPSQDLLKQAILDSRSMRRERT